MPFDREILVTQPALRKAGAEGAAPRRRRSRSCSSATARLFFTRKVMPQTGHL